MKPTATILIVAALALAACAPTADLGVWGEYLTPTAVIPANQSPAAETPTVPPPTATNSLLELFLPTVTFTPTPTLILPTQSSGPTATSASQSELILYYAQSGDTLQVVANRFGVSPSEITSPKNLPGTGLIDPGILLFIPRRIAEPTTPNIRIMPDAELIFSASAADFNTAQFIINANGYLSTFRQWTESEGWMSGMRTIERASYENSISPRILLALLEYKSHWVYSAPYNAQNEEYPMGFESIKYRGLFLQMVWTINQLYAGYYGWRAGTLTELTFPNGETLRLNPELNAGTAALQYFFSRQYNRVEWEQILDPNSVNSFMALYVQMFGDPVARAQAVDPIFPPGVTAPKMVLPFEPNREWSFTGGPHGAWEHDGPLAAVDFAPSLDRAGCGMANSWVVAAAPGLVVRSGNGVVMVDMDGDGLEQTGWNILYLHVATEDRVAKGTWLKTDDHIGHASCEGGASTGTHLHFARKYNGEWIPADGPIPMILSGWTVHAGAKPYEGTMTRGSRTITADPVGQAWSIIIRKPDD
jgi:murein DD-endopeptidase MepM/ murein hydrolase activator NlpD